MGTTCNFVDPVAIPHLYLKTFVRITSKVRIIYTDTFFEKRNFWHCNGTYSVRYSFLRVNT